MRSIDTTEIEKDVVAWKEGTDGLAGVRLIEHITEEYGECIDVDFQYCVTWIRADNLINLINYNMNEWGDQNMDLPTIDRQWVFLLVSLSDWMTYNIETDSFCR